MNKVLVVAFDGMDKELIDEFELENIRQEEYGSVDNSTGVHRRMTGELFSTFITGGNFEEHGITSLNKSLSLRDRFFSWLLPEYLVERVPGLYTLRDFLTEADSLETSGYTREDLESETLFDEIDASLPLYVPVYRPRVHFLDGYPHSVFRNFGRERFLKEARHDTEVRLREGSATQPAFFDVSKDFWDFIMLHLHDPDSFQDLGLGDLEEEYNRLDEIAGEILDEYGDEWTVIFMSDHGRPEDKRGPHEHNKNAFYSCNRELFGGETPHITDFHDKILELVRSK